MANKSSKSPSGEQPDQKNEFIRKQEVDKADIRGHSGTPPSGQPRRQENLEHRGYEEDQPHNPVRNAGATRQEQENMPTGEPDKNEKP